MAERWRERVCEAERVQYGAGILGALLLLAAERRLPTEARYASRRVARVASRAALAAFVALAAVLVVAGVVRRRAARGDRPRAVDADRAARSASPAGPGSRRPRRAGKRRPAAGRAPAARPARRLSAPQVHGGRLVGVALRAGAWPARRLETTSKSTVAGGIAANRPWTASRSRYISRPWAVIRSGRVPAQAAVSSAEAAIALRSPRQDAPAQRDRLRQVDRDPAHAAVVDAPVLGLQPFAERDDGRVGLRLRGSGGSRCRTRAPAGPARSRSHRRRSAPRTGGRSARPARSPSDRPGRPAAPPARGDRASRARSPERRSASYRCMATLITVPSGSLTKKRRMPQGSSVSG